MSEEIAASAADLALVARLTEERDRAARWMTDQAIVNPDRLAAVMVPGF